MKALSVRQPFACLLCEGVKTVEVRSFSTVHRGPLLILSTRTPKDVFWQDPEDGTKRLLHAGAMIGVVEVLDCRPMVPEDAERALCDYRRDAWSWVVAPRRWCKPTKWIGQQGLFEVHDSFVELLDEKLEESWIFDYPCPQGTIKYREGMPLLTIGE